MKFTERYKIDKNLNEEQLKKVKENAYISFCVEFVKSLSERLNLRSEEGQIKETDNEGKEIIYDAVKFSIDLPRVKLVNTCRRKYMKVNQDLGLPFGNIPIDRENDIEKILKSTQKEGG